MTAGDGMNEDSLTHKNDSAWSDAIREARSRGVSIAAFGDTHDKVVLHLGHLGYDFDYA